MTTVLLYCDEPVLAKGLAVLLFQTGDFDLVSCCPKAGDLSGQLELHRPDVLLVDLTVKFTFGLLSGLQNLVPQTKIILWVHSISTESAMQAMSLGVRGILRKTVPIDTLLRCLVHVSGGELWFERAMTDCILSAKRYALTRREGQLVALVTQSLKNREIAAALSLSENTVKVYLSHLFQKLQVKDRFELALYGIKNLYRNLGSMDVTPTVSMQNATSSVEHPPRAFFVERTHERQPRPILRGLRMLAQSDVDALQVSGIETLNS
jgi:two-component system nitrate/nitrite response regulator NarL